MATRGYEDLIPHLPPPLSWSPLLTKQDVFGTTGTDGSSGVGKRSQWGFK